MDIETNSFTTSFSWYLNKTILQAQPYFTGGYASKGYGYSINEFNDMNYIPGGFILVGVRSTIPEISDRLSGKGGFGFTFSENGGFFSFELSINFVLFKN